MAETSKNKIYYNDDENSVADILIDMRKTVESVDDAIEKSKYDDTQIKQDITNIKAENTEQELKIASQKNKVEELEKENERLREQIPTGEVEGENIRIEDSADMVFKEIRIEGNSKQETTSIENGDEYDSPNPEHPSDIKTVGSNVKLCVCNNNLLNIEDKETTDYVQHEEQTYIMPIQQEMLEDDYIDFENEEEVHMWRKLIITGDEEWVVESVGRFGILKQNLDLKPKSLSTGNKCNYYKENTPALTWAKQQGFCIDKDSNLRIFDSIYSSNSDLEGFKAYLKEQYEAGTPVIIYYKLQEEIRVAFTEEQREVAKQIKNARTYKNVTNIYSTDEVEPIIKVTYYKDLETINNNFQSQLDEIKKWLSTTENTATEVAEGE